MTILLSGCFDPFHHGHVDYLIAGLAVLAWEPHVCAIAPDAEVQATKRRPVLLPAAARARVVEAIHNGSSLSAYQNRLTTRIGSLADVLASLPAGVIVVKGSDWTHDRGLSNLVARYGAGLIFIGLPRSASSTQLLRDWQERANASP